MESCTTHLEPDRLPDPLHGGAVERLPTRVWRLRQPLEERLVERGQARLVGVAVHHDVQDAARHDLSGGKGGKMKRYDTQDIKV